MTKQDRFQTMKAIASEWRKYAEALDDEILQREAENLDKIACDYGEIALGKFHKDTPEGTEEQNLEDDRKGAPDISTEQRLTIKRKKFSK